MRNRKRSQRCLPSLPPTMHKILPATFTLATGARLREGWLAGSLLAVVAVPAENVFYGTDHHRLAYPSNRTDLCQSASTSTNFFWSFHAILDRSASYCPADSGGRRR